jgi:hypothetical protein
MGNLWIFYCWVLVLPLMVANQARARRRRQMGPRVLVDAAEFLQIAEQEKGVVIKGPRVLWQGRTYVVRSGDYYYFTTTKQPLTLPPGLEIKEARRIFL